MQVLLGLKIPKTVKNFTNKKKKRKLLHVCSMLVLFPDVVKSTADKGALSIVNLTSPQMNHLTQCNIHYGVQNHQKRVHPTEPVIKFS